MKYRKEYKESLRYWLTRVLELNNNQMFPFWYLSKGGRLMMRITYGDVGKISHMITGNKDSKSPLPFQLYDMFKNEIRQSITENNVIWKQEGKAI